MSTRRLARGGWLWLVGGKPGTGPPGDEHTPRRWKRTPLRRPELGPARRRLTGRRHRQPAPLLGRGRSGAAEPIVAEQVHGNKSCARDRGGCRPRVAERRVGAAADRCPRHAGSGGRPLDPGRGLRAGRPRIAQWGAGHGHAGWRGLGRRRHWSGRCGRWRRSAAPRRSSSARPSSGRASAAAATRSARKCGAASPRAASRHPSGRRRGGWT